MRVLFSSTLGYGHVFPMVPLAQACLAAGHDVLWVAGEPAGPLVEAAGIPYAAAGLDAHWVRTAPPARPSPQRLCACSTSSRFACRQKRFRRRSPRCPRLPTSRRRCPGLRARPAEIHLPRLRALGRAPAAAPARYRGRDIDVPREAATAGTVKCLSRPTRRLSAFRGSGQGTGRFSHRRTCSCAAGSAAISPAP